jgi:hypothetical protein
VQDANAEPSKAHRNVAPGSDVNEKLAAEVVDGFVGPSPITAPAPGASSIVVRAGVVSTVHVYEAAAPVFPAASVAFTANVCEPSASPVYVFGDAQAANAAPSSAHWKFAPASELKVNVASTSLVGSPGEVRIVAVGAPVSTVHVYGAAAPVLPAASLAFTWKVCEPSASAV